MRPHRLIVCIALLAVLGMAALLPGGAPKAGAQEFAPRGAETPALAAPSTSRSLFFVSSRNNRQAIYRYDFADKSITQITDTATAEAFPSASPDGKRVCFESLRTGNYEIFCTDWDGNNPVNLTNDPGQDGMPRFSPDGTLIAYHRWAVGTSGFQIWVMHADGSNKRQLTFETGYMGEPFWFPSGTKLVFDGDKPDRNLLTINLDGSGLTVINDQPGEQRSPSVSPDGAYIYYDSSENIAFQMNSSFQIYRMRSDGSDQTLLTDAGENMLPQVSPDGTLLAFRSNRNGNGLYGTAIYVSNTDGTGQFQLVNSGSDSLPAWAPTLAPAVTISGKVTDGHGNSLVGVVVRLTDPSGQLVSAKKPDGTTAEVRTATSERGDYTLAAYLAPGDYRVEVQLQDANGRKRVLFGPSQIEMFAAAAISITPDQTEYTLPINFGDDQHLVSPLPGGDKAKLDDLATIYFHTWEVDNFITTTLPHPQYQAVGNVWAFSGAAQTAYYAVNNDEGLKSPVSGKEGVILITDAESVFGHVYMNVEWHESFHHLMWQVLPQAMSAGPDYGFPHDGFANPSTRASWVEGWAEFWPCVMKQAPLYQISNKDWVLFGKVLDSGYVSIEYNWQAWDYNLWKSREEFAVAGVLWDLYDGTDESGDSIQLPVSAIWSILTQSNPITITNVNELYRSLTRVETRRAYQLRIDQLNSIFISHGFYAETVWELPEDGAYALIGDYRRYNGEEVGWGGRLLHENEPRPNVAPVPNAYLKVNLADSNASSSTLTVTLNFDQPYYDYSYTVEVPDPSALIYVEPPPTRTLALVTVTAANGAQTSQPFTLDNQTYWQRVAESTTGYAAETTLTLAANPPEVAIAGLRAVMTAAVVAEEPTALAATVDAGSAVSYSWDFGDGTTSEGALVTHSYSAAGVYTATVTARNALGSAKGQVAATVHAAASAPPTGAPTSEPEASLPPDPMALLPPAIIAPVVALLPPEAQPYWLYLGGGGVALVVVVIGGVLWRIRRPRPARSKRTQVAPKPARPNVAQHPNAPPATLPQALAAVQRGDLVAASAMLRELTEREPSNAEAWLTLGLVATRQRDYGDARLSFQVAQTLGHPEAAQFLAWLRRQMGA